MEQKETRLKRGFEAYMNKPGEGAKIEDWVEWANRIESWLKHKKKEEKQRRAKVKKIKESLTGTEKANQFYKAEIEKIRTQLDKYESSWVFKLFIKRAH